jgi:hypothetical protein
VSALNLADGPAMYLGGSMMTFALPLGAFIVIASALFFLYRWPHSGPKLKYLASPPVASVLTREPGPVPAPAVKAAGAPAEPAAGAPAADDPRASTADPSTADPSVPDPSATDQDTTDPSAPESNA